MNIAYLKINIYIKNESSFFSLAYQVQGVHLQVKGLKNWEKLFFFSLKTIYVHDPMSHVTLLFDQFCIYMLKLTHKMS